MAIETAIVAPLLLILALGSFEVSRLVARQHELQTGASEGEAIALASNMGATSNVGTVKSILKTSLDLDDEQVDVTMLYRCGTDAALVNAQSSCDADDVVSTYMRITLTDRYDPIWTQYGVSQGYDFQVVRQVQLS